MKRDEKTSPYPAITVLHVLPSLTVGGIETMMTRFLSECSQEIDYRLLILSTEDATAISMPAKVRPSIQYFGASTSPITYLRAAHKLVKNRSAIIVSSTWKAALVVWIAKRLSTIASHVAFTHRSTTAHHIDGILRAWQVKDSLFNLADSQSSAEWVSRETGRSDVTVINPIFLSLIDSTPKPKNLSICFIGRLAPVKNLETVIKVVEALVAQGLSLTFHIYGPDAGKKQLVDEWIAKNQGEHINKNLQLAYLGALPPQEVHEVAARYHFIVSCSHTEGFAMSIAEAMQVGTIPIVGKIGGPTTYCCPENSISLDDYTDTSIENVVRKVREIWHEPSLYRSMSESARRTFITTQLFPFRYIAFLKQVAAMPVRTRRN
jgi:glycosyltransferase involved in cell wall biosynthesis